MQKEMPKWNCHKQVWALKIDHIEVSVYLTTSIVITPVDKDYDPFEVSEEYYLKKEPKAGGYYVVYEDGYLSYSPADVFEAGYTLNG